MSSDEEADNFETVTVPPETSNDDPPVYVNPQSQSIYQSQITKKEHIFAVCTYATRHNLSDQAITDLLQLIQLHIPGNHIVGVKNKAAETISWI